ncbi:MAG: signal peptide peptidase SppA [Gammaproteobacteria bacterium]|nr:signal peptide peptidase SppA [Gammaproteobacteria bacterium]
MKLLTLLKKLLGWIWWALDGVRKLLQLFVVLFLVVLLLASLAPDVVDVPDDVALVLAPDGALVDQLSGSPLDRALARARGAPVRETLVKDLIDAVRAAADDDRIRALVLRLDGLGGAGLSKLQEVADEIVQFKESGKPVIAVGDGFSRNQYYLAAHADEIFMHPMGLIFVDGYSRYPTYFREAFEKVLVDFHVWAIGEYKSFVEPVSRDDMSDEDRESAGEYLGALWDTYQVDVTSARGLEPDALQRYADNATALLAAAGGDTGRLALDQQLVDQLLARDQSNARIRALVEPEDEDDEEEDEEVEVGYPRIGHAAYLRAVRRDDQPDEDADSVAVLVAAGTILDGEQPPGTIGGDSTAALIRGLHDDESVKALVLRVDSGGGSAFASDVILRELEVFQESGRPLVVSMGSVAASGGYWISMSADEIWASSATLTGSIGIGATIPTVPRTLDALGIHVDGVGTTELAGQFDLMRPLGPDIADMIGQAIQYGYENFITKVAAHREQDLNAVDAVVARGRVWVGSRAQDHDLVDRIGNLDDAIASAAELAGLAEDEYETRYIEKELELAEQIALELVRVASPVLSELRLAPEFSPEFQRLLEIAAEPFKWVDSLNDPKDLYAYCFCAVQ